MSSDESDLEVRTVMFNKNGKTKKIPESPTLNLLVKRKHINQGKPPIKNMVNQALIELHTRKGVSIYAIKKYMDERFEINSDKMNFYIKKYIKKSVENGTIIQTKGIGASGSFRIVPVKNVMKKKKEEEKKIMEPKKKSVEKPKPTEKPKIPKKPKMAEKPDTVKAKKAKTMAKVKENSVENVAKPKKIKKAENVKKTEIQKDAVKKTPMKKKNKIIKRKSIGSIIKKPKMKPKAVKT